MEQISVREMYEGLINNRKVLMLSMVIALLLGVFAYCITPNQYTGEVTLSIEGDVEPFRGGLGNLASLAGIDLQDQKGLNVLIYEDIVESTPYLLNVVNNKVAYLGDSVYLKDYLTQAMLIKFPEKFRGMFSDKKKVVSSADTGTKEDTTKSSGEMPGQFRHLQVLDLSDKEKKAIRILKDEIDYSLGTKSPIIKIGIKLQDPSVSAQAAKIVVEELAEYVSKYQYDKQYHNLAYLEKQVSSAKEELFSSQTALARAKDRNRNLISAVPTAGLERLQTEYQIAFNVYNSLALKLENARINIQEDKPVFVVLDPPVEMKLNSPTAPRLLIYLIFSIILGGIAGITIILSGRSIRRNV